MDDPNLGRATPANSATDQAASAKDTSFIPAVVLPIPAKNVESFTINGLPADVVEELLGMKYGEPAR